MKLPEVLVVLGKEIPVVITSNLPEEKLADTDGNTIWLSDKSLKKDRLEIVLHELWHCYIRRSGIFQTTHSVETEEIEADGFANIITDNFILRARRK